MYQMSMTCSDERAVGVDHPTRNERRVISRGLADAITNAGQLAMPHRLCGAPVPEENFILADITAGSAGREPPQAVAPDAWWRPDQPPLPPGPDPGGAASRPHRDAGS